MPTNPKRRISLDRKHWIILFCLFVLLAFALAYLFIYIPSNEKYLNERRFNAMRRIENNIDARQNNTFRLIESIATSLGNPSVNQESLREYLENGFSASQPLVFNRYTIKEGRLPDSLEKKQPGTTIETNAEHANGNILFTLKKYAGGKVFDLSMNYTVERFFGPLLQGAGFDEFVVVVNGEIIHESFPSGLNGSKFDSLLHINRFLVGANSKKLAISGLEYQCFIQPFSLGNVKKGSFIMGMLKFEKFQAERIQLPANIVIHLITAGIILLILLPWIKLFNMGAKDRLSLFDGALSFVVAMLLVSLMFMGFSTLALRYQSLGKTNGMENIARKIEQRSSQHFAVTRQRLAAFDSLASYHEVLARNLTRINSYSKMGAGTQYSGSNGTGPLALPDSLREKIAALANADSVYQVFWLDAQTGIELFNWNIDGFNAPAPNLSGRNYFKMQQAGKQDFSVEQVISWTTGMFRTVMAMRSRINPSRIACISFPLTPVNKPVLPAGYRFAITDENGEVLYHSSDIHNLNENFPDETSEPDRVRSAIGSHTSHHLNTRYKGAETSLFIRPVSFNGILYRVVVTYDKGFETARDTGSFSFTLFMLLSFFLLVFLQLMVVVWVSARKSRLSAFKMETDWIWPRPSHYNVYRYTAVYHLVLLAVLLVIYYRSAFLGFLYMLLMAICLATLFINFLYISHYRMEKRITVIRYKKRNLAAISVLWLLINFFALWQLWDDTTQVMYFLLFEVAAIVPGVLIYRYFTMVGLKKELHAGHARFIGSYAQMAITRLLISSGLPVMFFYQYAYNNQLAVQAHYKQLQFASAYAANGMSHKKNTAVSGNYYTDNYWIKDTLVYSEKRDTAQAKNNLAIAGNLLNGLRVYKTQASHLMDAAAHNLADDSIYVYSPPLGAITRTGIFSTQVGLRDSGYVTLSTNAIGFRYPLIKSIPTMLYWLLFLLGIATLYLLIKRVIRQIFALDVPGEITSDTLAHALLGFASGNKLTYITGLPGSGKMKFVFSATSPEKRVVMDLFEPPGRQLEWKEADTVIFNHFEYILFNKEACKQLLSLVETMMISDKKPALIIVSTIHADRAIALIGKLFGESEPYLRDRYQAVLGHFNAIILPIKTTEASELDQWETENRQQWMKDEFGVAAFTERLRLPLKREYFREKINPAALQPDNGPLARIGKKIRTVTHWFNDSGANAPQNAIWSLQNISGIFYYYIWQSLSPEERYLVYDLAEEGLVNQSNKYHLSMLIQKGLVKRKEPYGQLELINDSFKDFVLVTVNREEALQLKNELKASGSWGELKTPFMLIIVGILVILIASQQEAFSTIIGYLTAVAALIPTINAIFSFVKPASSAQH